MNATQNAQRPEGKTLPEQNVPTDLIRFDKNLASNGLDFVNSYEEDGQLIFDLLFYIALTYQRDLFGFGKIYPDEFSAAMGYDRRNLLKKHPKPAQIAKNTRLQKEFEIMEKEGHYNKKMSNGEYLFYSVLDNALYRAGKETLKFSYEVKNFENKEKVQAMKFIPLLSDVNKHYTANNKIYYSYKLSETIEAHLSKYFMLASPKAVKQLRQKNSVFLYFYLKNLQQNLHLDGKKTGTPHFNLLCDIAEINIVEPKWRKQKLIKKLKELQDKTDLKFDFRFNKGKGRFEYNIEIDFHANLKELSKAEKWERLRIAFEDEYLHEVKTFFFEFRRTNPTVKWSDWVRNNKFNLKDKIKVFVQEHNKMFRPIEPSNKIVLDYFELNRLPD